MRKAVFIHAFVALFGASMLMAQGPEPTGWYAGDMHVHRSCGGSPEAVSSVFNRMSTQNLSALSLLADMGNGEVQNPVTDLPLVNGQDASISTQTRKLHWDAEWHWDATYSQYPHQALGGHIVALGLSDAQQMWREYTYPILDWAHQQNGIAGFAHMQYLTSEGLPTTLTCCTPIEYPVEVALGASDFISEDVDDVTSSASMYPENFIQAYYRLLNSGFRPGFAAGTDYPCNGGADPGALLTYVQVAGGQMTYRNWIDGIAKGRTVVSRNGHNEFLNLTVNGTATPGDEILLGSAAGVNVTVQWTATKSLSGIIELLQNGTVVSSKSGSVSSSNPLTLSATVNFAKSGWLAARRVASSDGEHYVHTAAVYVTVNNAPVRANTTDPQYYVDWVSGLLTNISPGGSWNYFFPTGLNEVQSRYQDALALYQQIASEAAGSAPTLIAIAISPSNAAMATGNQQSFTAVGTYSNGTTLNITGQMRWISSSPSVASISVRGLAAALNPGVATISATLNGVTSTTSLTVSTTPLLITTQSLAGGTINLTYSATLSATGGKQPYTWSIASGVLPTGLSLNSSTGSITGMPTVVGSFNFTAQVADSSSPQQIATQGLSIAITSSGAGSCPCTIWPGTTAPGTPDSGPDSAGELGVKFRSDIAGYITGIRFYKGSGNTGVHVGNLWSSSGSLLATVTFSGETSSAWQQANFSSPVAITANTVYVASYHTNVGHYSDDQNYFAGTGIDNPPLHALADGVSSFDGVYAYGSSSSLPSQGWNSSNYWVDVVFTPTSASTPPTVVSVAPSSGATGSSIGTSVTARFSESMMSSSITGATFLLVDSSGYQVPANVTYASATSTATLTPTIELTPSRTYTATVKGGANGVEDFSGDTMTSDVTWSFTTGAAPANHGPGGPILIIANVLNPFTQYYSEILNAEGFNEYTVADIAAVTSGTLSNYDIAILGDMSLTAAQVSMLSNWVNRGGHLIAMRPDEQLAALLGLTTRASTLSNAYLQVKTDSGSGVGIIGQTIQFHGSADLYSVSGATAVATLYSDANTPTASPAVTLANAGTGQAAAFTYDLARSVVYTRQGNPAWVGQDRDGQAPPFRSDDLYFGAASFDPESDWVDLSKVAIPQADEQQRLLANLVLQMESADKPLPRFWYFPSGFKAVLVLTGDDHGSFYSGSATSQRFNDDLADSAAGCSVADWTCVRATSYLFPQSLASNPLTNSQAAAYVTQGFEIAMHGDSTPTCSNWTTSQLDSWYTSLLASFAAQFPSLPAPKTHRMHCISWSDYDSQPKVELKHGIRLDTTYYYWPPSWVNDQPGMFTGSGMPMRFADRDGNLIDVYQATTQMTDESGQSYPFNSDKLLDNALGATGFYGAFVVNAHDDQGSYPGIAPNVVSSAQSRGVPIISSLQLLTWVDGRNSSSFGAITWSGNTLTFNITQATGARNLQALLPTKGPSGTLSSITRGGSPVTFTTQTIKGVSYAMFAAVSGSYQAVYGGVPPAVVLTSLSISPATVVGGTGATGKVTLSESAPTSGATVTLTNSNTAIAQIPFNVVVPSGNTSATFAISTSAVSANTNVTITGFYGSTQTTTLSVTPATVSLTSLTLNPTTVIGGSSSTGTVTLSGAAPIGGLAVALSSSNTNISQVPASVTVAAGSATATFNVTTFSVAGNSTVNITGKYGSIQAVATLTINTATATVSALSLNPPSVTGGINSTGTVTLTGPAPTGGAAVALQSSITASATVPCSVTVPAGSTSTTFRVTTYAVATNTSTIITGTLGTSRTASLTVNTARLSSICRSPTAVVGGASSTGTVTLNGPAPSGGELITLQTSNSAVAQVPANAKIAAGSTSATFTIATTPLTTNTSVTITATYAGIVRTTTLTINAATLSSIFRSPDTVVGGASSTGTVTLNGAAPMGGATVTLQSSNVSAAQVPASVSVAGGVTSASFTITTSPVATNTSVTISGTSGVTRTTPLTVNAATLSSISRSPSSVVGGNNATGTITLNGAAPTGGATVTLQSNNTAVAKVPPTVTIPAGRTNTTFTITTSGVAASTSVTLTGVYGNTRTTTLTVSIASLTSLNLNPSTVTGGSSSTGTLTLNGAAPPAGAVVSLTSSRTSAAQVPSSATIPAGSRSTTFTVTSSAVHGTSSTISGTYRSTTRSATLTIQ